MMQSLSKITTMTIAEPLEYTVQRVERVSERQYSTVQVIKHNEYDSAQTVKRHPDYGYDGQIDNLRNTEYAHLGGTFTVFQS